MNTTQQSLNLDRIPESMRSGVEEYARLLTDLGGDNLLSITMFGSVVAGSFDPDRHAARNVVTLKTMDLDFLSKLADRGARLGKLKISAPFTVTPEYITASLDSFPIEFIEIVQMHATILGDDPFSSDLKFAESDVRLACERELKRVLISLRQGLLSAAGRERVLEAVEMDIGEGVLRTLRAILWIKGMKDAKPGNEVISEAEKLTKGKLDGLRASLDPTAQHDFKAFKKLHAEVVALAEVADAL